MDLALHLKSVTNFIGRFLIHNKEKSQLLIVNEKGEVVRVSGTVIKIARV